MKFTKNCILILRGFFLLLWIVLSVRKPFKNFVINPFIVNVLCSTKTKCLSKPLTGFIFYLLFSPPAIITDVDMRSHENNLAHRTREIDRERLIVRRGQPFSITLQCFDPLPPKHHLELVLHLGRHRRPERCSLLKKMRQRSKCVICH